MQSSGARKTSEEKILVNDLTSAYEVLKRAKKAGKLAKVDIVLDNAGFELYVDLILAGFLLSTGLANNIILHSKSIPWFVSDVIPADFGALLNILASPNTFDSISEEETLTTRIIEPLTPKELDALEFVFQQWTSFHNEGQIILRENRFWTEAGSFWRLPGTATQLHNDLKACELVIFKGDLNYRKLTGDAKWDPTTPFTKSLGPMGPGSGVNILSLRTCKSDVIVGLKEGEDERLRSFEGCDDSETRMWAWTGKWAVMSFSYGKE
ncbi:Protein-glutamate O-methyltransferase [Golovinomyces cichoracearum]|uniref:Sugar phosphate phosphatase n=1 Tax=Golovinomyces cichoracearum TaxID=62708 RepID=A0A420H922_9PEZI|nr:Protein-glutamate O-methyltransferase [Golovinomyces cichoracearum]